jgi:hypothetical protein
MLNQEAKNKLHGYAIKYLGLRPYVRGWLKGDCPDCGRENKFGLNLGMNRTNCFICGYHPSPIVMVVDKEGLSSISEAWAFLKTFEGLRYIEPTVEKVKAKPVHFPEGYTNIALGNSKMANIIRGYVERRGFDIAESALKGWGYCTSGEYLGYLILPFYTAGELTYFNGRRVVGTGPKYNNPKIDDFGVGKSLILYNADALALYDEVFLLEGVLNADTIGENGIATGGKNISDYQISLINKAPVKKVSIVLDPDAYEDSIKVALQMVFYKDVRLVTWEGNQDVNDLGREEAMKRIESKPWLSYNDLLKLKHNAEATKHSHNKE